MKCEITAKSVTLRLTHKEFCALYDTVGIASGVGFCNPKHKKLLAVMVGQMFKALKTIKGLDK